MRQSKFIDKIMPLADKLFRLALSITKNRQDAEDVVQDTMFSVWKKQSEWDTIDNLEGYCLRSVRNIALDKVALMVNKNHEDFSKLTDFQEQTTTEEAIDRKEQLDMVFEILKLLPEKQRTIFQLRDVEGFSYKEITEVMDISEDQVKVNLFRARQKIRENLKLMDKNNEFKGN